MLRKLGLLSILVCFLMASGCKSSQNRSLDEQVRWQLSSDDWKVRESALLTLREMQDEGVRPGKDIEKRVVMLLDSETKGFKGLEDKLKAEGKAANQAIDERNKQYPAREFDNYIKIISHYLAVNKVERSLPVVFQLIAQTDFNVTPAILTAYGKDNLNFFIDKADTGTSREREVALSVLSILLDTSIECDDFDVKDIPSLNREERNMVKPAFIKAVNDSDYNVRYVALSGLKKLISDPDIKALIERMAKTDPEDFIRNEAGEILGKN